MNIRTRIFVVFAAAVIAGFALLAYWISSDVNDRYSESFEELRVDTANSEQYVHDLVEYLFDYALIITDVRDGSQDQPPVLEIYPNPVIGAGVVRYQMSDFSKKKFEVRIRC